jgi:drug/metabolite transporter (DMT)-like permease
VLTVILGFTTAVVYGFADFFGAIASRKISSLLVTAVSGIIGFFFLISMVPFFGANFSEAAIITGIAAGVASAIGISALYASLAIGPIAIVSPLGAVLGALVPMTFGFFIGDRFGAIAWLALALILVAVILVGFIPGADVRLPSAKGLLFATIAGAGIGTILIVLKYSPEDSGLASILVMRLVSAIFLNIVLVANWLRLRSKREPKELRAVPAKFWWAVIAAGVFDSSANIFFTLALRSGSLSVVSVLTALYPLGTIILARIVLKERIAKVQMFGVLLALTGSAILAVA